MESIFSVLISTVNMVTLRNEPESKFMNGFFKLTIDWHWFKLATKRMDL